MPELPEVETTLLGITPHINKKTVYQPKLRWPIEKKLSTLLPGKKLLNLTRRGKYLILTFDNGHLLLHLGMSGSLRILKTPSALEKHDHFEIIFNNKKVLRLRDPRRFGAVLWTQKDWQKHKLIIKLGPEPLSSDFNVNYLYAKARNRSIAIKSFIMNSHHVVGVGNIYVSEALFQAGIHPTRQTQRISKQRLENLVTAIKQVLDKAISEGGTTLKDFTNANGKPGYFTQHLNVYGRKEEPCYQCNTNIKHQVIAQRATYYCPRCQR